MVVPARVSPSAPALLSLRVPALTVMVLVAVVIVAVLFPLMIRVSTPALVSAVVEMTVFSVRSPLPPTVLAEPSVRLTSEGRWRPWHCCSKAAPPMGRSQDGRRSSRRERDTDAVDGDISSHAGLTVKVQHAAGGRRAL